jgi:hypothetical protein
MREIRGQLGLSEKAEENRERRKTGERKPYRETPQIRGRFYEITETDSFIGF